MSTVDSIDYGFKLISIDRETIMQFTLLDLETERYPSISLLVDVVDRSFRGSINVWFDKNSIEVFLMKLIKLNKDRDGQSGINSMSPEEFELLISSTRKDQFIITYKLHKRKYSNNSLIETKLVGSFDFDTEYFNQFEQDLRGILKLLD